MRRCALFALSLYRNSVKALEFSGFLDSVYIPPPSPGMVQKTENYRVPIPRHVFCGDFHLSFLPYDP